MGVEIRQQAIAGLPGQSLKKFRVNRLPPFPSSAVAPVALFIRQYLIIDNADTEGETHL